MAKKHPKGHVVAAKAVKRRAGCMYFVDAHGNVRETEMKGKRKKGQGARNDLCKPAKRRKRRR
jgi:hypothetical protein